MPDLIVVFFFSSRRRHTRCLSDWSSDVCCSDLVGLEEDVRDRDPVPQVRPLALVPRVLVAADIVPGPAVEGALLDVGGVVRDEVVAQAVALRSEGRRVGKGGGSR